MPSSCVAKPPSHTCACDYWRDFLDLFFPIFWWNSKAFWIRIWVSFLRVFRFGTTTLVSFILVCYIYSLRVFSFKITIFYFQRLPSTTNICPIFFSSILWASLKCFELCSLLWALSFCIPLFHLLYLASIASWWTHFGVYPRVLVLPYYFEVVCI